MENTTTATTTTVILTLTTDGYRGDLCVAKFVSPVILKEIESSVKDEDSQDHNYKVYFSDKYIGEYCVRYGNNGRGGLAMAYFNPIQGVETVYINRQYVSAYKGGKVFEKAVIDCNGYTQELSWVMIEKHDMAHEVVPVRDTWNQSLWLYQPYSVNGVMDDSLDKNAVVFNCSWERGIEWGWQGFSDYEPWQIHICLSKSEIWKVVGELEDQEFPGLEDQFSDRYKYCTEENEQIELSYNKR